MKNRREILNEMSGELIRFLKERMLLDTYVGNCISEIMNGCPNTWGDWTKQDCAEIIDAFEWKGTMQGHEFWDDIDNEYNNYAKV
jgi:hypothetical protein